MNLGEFIRILAVLTLASLTSACVMQPFWQRLTPADEVPASQPAVSASPAEQPHPTATAPEIEQPVSAPQASESVAVEEPQPVNDLWQRIRQGMSLPHGGHAAIDQERQWYARHADYLQRVTKRARPYLYYITEQVEARGMPLEIALLPVVESAFQPFAYSPGRAAGLWQFIPSTGRHFGLKQNWWYDGRRDIAASTRAALDYLQRLQGEFNGDWLLALAAYNCGERTVARAIRRNEAAGKATDFWSLDLPRETRAYVPKLLAVSQLVSAPSHYHLSLTPIANGPYLTPIETGGQIDLARAADLAGTSVKTLYRLNPGFNRWATDPDGPHRLLVPVDKARQFSQALADLPVSQRVTWIRHDIRQGESLSVIAHHYHTDIRLLRRINHLHGNRIRAGKHLLVPRPGAPAQDYVLSMESRKKALHKAHHQGQRRLLTVRAGDTLWDLARAHHVSTAKLAAWNQIAPADSLHPGQQLVLWSNTRTRKSAPTRPTRAASLPHSQRLTYRVRNGDSLWLIARRFKVSVADLRQWNDLPSHNRLQPGQTLEVRVDITRQYRS